MKKTNLLQTLKLAEQVLSHSPSGVLLLSRSHNQTQFYIYGEDNKKYYLSKQNVPMLKAMAQKMYCQEIVKEATKQLKIRDQFDKRNKPNCISDVYKRMPKEIKPYISAFELPVEDKVRQWLNTPYKAKIQNDDAVCYLTDKGENVRSKSEVIIANKLFHHNIPYRYECRLKLDDEMAVYPDFTIINPRTGTVYFWEHFGLMSNQSYAETFVLKMNTYANNGILPGERLICTFESEKSPISLDLVEKMLQRYLL